MADNYQIDLTLEEIFGTGISSIEQTTVSTMPGGENVWTVTLTNGNSYDFTVLNGTAGGDPIPVLTVSAMTDTTAVYLYLGSETGYTFGHWYYYNGAWTDGGAYGAKGDKGDDGFSPTASVSKSGTTTTITITDENGTTTAQVEDGVAPEAMIADKVADWADEHITVSQGVVIDTSLLVSGAAADSKAVGDEIADLRSAIEQGSSLTSAIKSALLQIAQKVAYIDENGQDYYDDLYDALYPPIVVTAITLNTNSLSFGTLNSTQQLTATTTPSGGAVTWSSSNTSVASVSQTGVVTSVGYGNATITATAGGVSAMCSVEVVQATLSSISAVYAQTGTVYNTDSLDSLKSDLVVTAHWDNSTTSTVASTDYTLSGTLTVGTSTITVSYSGKTTTFNVTVTQDIELPEGYTELEYIERTADNETQAFSSTGVTLNGTDTVVIEIGCMVTNTPSSSKSTGYFVGCRQNATGSTSVGWGLYYPSAMTSIGTYDGTSCLIEPNGGNSIQNIKCDIVATKTTTGQTVTDGTHTQTTTETPRPMASALYLFGIPNPGGGISMAARGRIYYLKITEGSTVKANLIPAKRTSDNACGFYDLVAEAFRTDSKYIAGPEV